MYWLLYFGILLIPSNSEIKTKNTMMTSMWGVIDWGGRIDNEEYYICLLYCIVSMLWVDNNAINIIHYLSMSDKNKECPAIKKCIYMYI